MHTSIAALQSYHKSLRLNVGLCTTLMLSLFDALTVSLTRKVSLDHLDPFWHSHHADGRCDGVTASNWSHSEFHWPAGLGEDGDNPGTKWQMLFMLVRFNSILIRFNSTLIRH